MIANLASRPLAREGDAMTDEAPIRHQIRHQLMLAQVRAEQSVKDLAAAIEALDAGNFYEQHAGDAKINLNVAGDQIQAARGMALVASMSTRGVLR